MNTRWRHLSKLTLTGFLLSLLSEEAVAHLNVSGNRAHEPLQY